MHATSQVNKRQVQERVMELHVIHYPMLSLQLESYDHQVDLKRMVVIVHHWNRLCTMPK
jgi:hypothetical protein